MWLHHSRSGISDSFCLWEATQHEIPPVQLPGRMEPVPVPMPEQGAGQIPPSLTIITTQQLFSTSYLPSMVNFASISKTVSIDKLM